MKQTYKVTATQDRKIKTVSGFEMAEEGYVVHLSFQEAESEQDAIDNVLAYHMLPGTKYDNIRAELS